MQKSFPSFNNSYHYEVLEQVEQKLSDPSLYNQVQREVDAYYLWIWPLKQKKLEHMRKKLLLLKTENE